MDTLIKVTREALRRTMSRLAYAYHQRRFKEIEAEYKLTGIYTYKDSDLTYAAWARCRCGAGLAHPKGCGPFHNWDCSDILTDRAMHKDKPGSVTHSDRYPFVFYEIKSEDQPSAAGATTRPLPSPCSRCGKIDATRCWYVDCPSKK